ncbi:MarR family winged helix-turn-helix transcriptional regulator [Actinoplanes sp. CA-252034]|uniref:MarR family winged helix-turn-helix transcriptional regulator n=1 Tax=Actinoplanes sp. CA-252034 TaxID=3239906 RepID=UPI003D953905
MISTPEDADGQRDRLLQALRAHGTAFTELGRLFGARTGLHTTDAAALVEILSAQDRGEPLTQAALSHRVGLTAGATSSLLNRLEKAGHVIRIRDSADRRVVTLRAADGVDTMVDCFFAPLVARIEAMMAGHSPEALAHAERFITDYVTTMSRFLDDLAAGEAPAPNTRI